MSESAASAGSEGIRCNTGREFICPVLMLIGTGIKRVCSPYLGGLPAPGALIFCPKASPSTECRSDFLTEASTSKCNRQRLKATHRQVRYPSQLMRIEAQIGQALDNRVDSDLGLDTRKHCTQAEVNTLA